MRITAIVLVASAAFACPPGAVAYTPPATQTYTISRQIEIDAIAVNLPTGINDLAKLEAAVASECPHGLVAAPQGPQRRDLEEEARWDVTLTGTSTLREPVDGFAEAQIEDGYRWHNRKLNALMHSYFRELLAYFRIRPTSLCRDIEGWAQTGYTKLPTGTVAFLAQRKRFQAHPFLVIARNRLLRRTETRAETRLRVRTESREAAQAQQLLPKLQATSSAVLATIGARPARCVEPPVPHVRVAEVQPAATSIAPGR
jgi:hypothetical protein